METKFKNFIIKNNLLKNSNKLLLAVSGGPDSLAMLNLFYKFRKEFNLNLAAAHLNHMFRKEAEAEANFVKSFAKKKKIKFFCKKVNVPQIIKNESISAEAAARKVRFSFFKEIMNQYDFDLLALAHHRDDQAETVLLNLFRGSGLQGLSGIQPVAEIQGLKIIHPMLELSKKEILNYCQNNNLEPCLDSSNKKNIYSRNIIRNKIFPIVENKINRNAKKVIARSSKLIAAENNFLQNLAQKEFNKIAIKENDNKIIIDFNNFKKLNQVLQRRICRYIYQQLNDDLDDLYFDHILEIEKLIKNNQTGRGVDIASGIRVEISYSDLVFMKKDLSEKNIYQKLKLEKNKKIKIDDKRSLEIEIIDHKNFSFVEDIKQAAFDYEKLNLPLFIRSRKPGDKIKPLGMNGHKKIKDILIDQKVPKYEREQQPLIVDTEDNIIWLVPYKISDDYKINKKTNKVLTLKLKYD